MGDEPTSVRVVATQLCARVPGGTGRYVEELLRGLVRRRPRDARVTAVATRDCAAVDRLGVDVERVVPPLPVLARLWERGLPPTPRGGGVLHAPTLMVPPVSRSTALVVTIHDVVPWTHPETLTAHGVAFHRRMGERAARDALVILTPTKAVASQVRDVLSPACEVRAVPPGVPALPTPGDARQRRLHLGLPDRYLLFVGTAEPRKGLDVLVQALAEGPLRDSQLVVVGPSGWGEVDIGELARHQGVAHRVLVTGRLEDEDLAATYLGASALAMPSRAEGFGFPVVEAMSKGVPVVVSDDPALVEVAGGAARVVPIGDATALATALAQAQDAPSPDVRQRGHERASAFDWDTTAAAMWQIYASVTPPH